ncbi:MAG: DNA polymerase elongation subunit (family B) [Planctomycetota bacterium]|jgi:DNA polymerase elongation subunit (family B)
MSSSTSPSSDERQATLVFDIEVAGFPWEEVDEATRGYLLAREKRQDRREAIPDRTALYPGLGKVITIAFWYLETEKGLVLLEGPPADKQVWEKVGDSEITRGDEVDLLTHFWEVVSKKDGRGRLPRLVTYNGRGYDGPILMTRSAQLGVQPTRQLVPYRYDLSEHCDLMDVFSYQGATRDRFSLDYWCRRFDVESPKGSIDGSQVGRAYREGRIEEIGEYCLRDVRATAELYRKVETTLIPLFLRGDS